MSCKNPPVTAAGKKLYDLLQQAAKGDIKRANKHKANQTLGHFECGFINEEMMVSSTKTILRKAKSLPPELEDPEDD